jgi:ABC-2 type transport system ATP-binding protein
MSDHTQLLSEYPIRFDSVSKEYSGEIGSPSQKALYNLSFSVHVDEILGLIGANGAGKSTAIRLLMDFIRPDQGTISLFDRPASDLSLRNQIGYLPEVASFPANLTILDLIRFTGATCDIPVKTRKERSEQLLQDLDLWEARRKPLRSYSKGMQQRANFVLALLNDPQVLILDEPMSGLDPLGRAKIFDLIFNLKKSGKTILFCSHILEDVDKLVDNILLLHKGKKLFYGTPAELSAHENQVSMAEAFVSRVSREATHA